MASKYMGNPFSFAGWNLKEFLKTRRQLLVTLVGGIGGWILTQDPAMSAIVAAGTEMVYAIVDYYISK